MKSVITDPHDLYYWLDTSSRRLWFYDRAAAGGDHIYGSIQLQ